MVCAWQSNMLCPHVCFTYYAPYQIAQDQVALPAASCVTPHADYPNTRACSRAWYAQQLSPSFLPHHYIHASCFCRDSRQVTFSVSNIVRWQRRLDFLITHLTGKACSRLETTTHAILRLAVHELVFQKLPAHAISEHVNLAKALVRPAAGNLVNGKHSCKR